MTDSCPVNTVDEHAARVVAALVVAIALAALWPPAMWLTAFLAVDFTIRAWVHRRFSPLRWIAKRVLAAAGVAPRPVYAPPKQFAARIGSVLTIAATVLHVTGPHAAAVGVTLALIVAASLEAIAGFCLACWLYPFIWRTRRAT